MSQKTDVMVGLAGVRSVNSSLKFPMGGVIRRATKEELELYHKYIPIRSAV
jgi:hypothetical protein